MQVSWKVWAIAIYTEVLERSSVECLVTSALVYNNVCRNVMTFWGGRWGCEVSCGGHQRQSGKTTTGWALDGAVFDFTEILAYLAVCKIGWNHRWSNGPPMMALWVVQSILGGPWKIRVNYKLLHRWHMDFRMFFLWGLHTILMEIDFKQNKTSWKNFHYLWCKKILVAQRAPLAKGKDHHGVSSGWSSVWHRSNTGLSSTQYEQIPIILGVWPFCLTPFFFRSITFWRAYG